MTGSKIVGEIDMVFLKPLIFIPHSPTFVLKATISSKLNGTHASIENGFWNQVMLLLAAPVVTMTGVTSSLKPMSMDALMHGLKGSVQ